ncbi:MAG: UDP-N-acetylglucosamine 2-epimerase (non-hydrolyzing) [Chloroflexota bacterium]|nr:MAG: UDP-N-acetylglucosamine 2-epimerase (non-hydrolyzing) [Chloroflexota bacterium]
MSPPRIAAVFGTRPEIVKLSPLIADPPFGAPLRLIHTGQHYSASMDAVFFADLELPAPDVNLGIGSGRHGEQTGAMMAAIERSLVADPVEAVLVQGDTNSALAGALVAAKMQRPIIHLEAGCRSGSRHQPEEINRVLIGSIASLHLAPNDEAIRNLDREGIRGASVVLVGSTAVDACLSHRAAANGRRSALLADLGVTPPYAIATVHRAESTQPDVLPGILDALADISREIPVILPLHPRAKAAGAVARADAPNLRVIEPLGYLDLLALLSGAAVAISDSGGIQEEAPALGVPVVIPRRETEWTDLVGPLGNIVAGVERADIVAATRAAMARPEPRANLPALSERVGAAERARVAIERFLAG